MINIFLNGHGFLKGGVTTVPAKCSVTFYCKIGKMYDSSWDKSSVLPNVTSGSLVHPATPSVAPQDWLPSTHNVGATVPDHWITRPGGIALVKKYTEQKAVWTNLDTTVKSADDLSDMDHVCVKSGGYPDKDGIPYTSLSSLFTYLSQNDLSVHVHWLACRSEELADQVIASVNVTLSPEAEQQQKNALRDLKDCSLVKSFAPIKWGENGVDKSDQHLIADGLAPDNKAKRLPQDESQLRS